MSSIPLPLALTLLGLHTCRKALTLQWAGSLRPSFSPKSAYTRHMPPKTFPPPAPAPSVLQHLPRARSPPSYPDPSTLGAPTMPSPSPRSGQDPVPAKVRKAAAALAQSGRVTARQRQPQCRNPRGRDCSLLSARAAAVAAAKDAQQTMRGPAGSANRLNRRPPGTARRAGACPVAAAYPRRRALPAPGPCSNSAAAATSSARVSGA